MVGIANLENETWLLILSKLISLLLYSCNIIVFTFTVPVMVVIDVMNSPVSRKA